MGNYYLRYYCYLNNYLMKNKLPTIKLQGKEYVQVKDRVLAFHELHTNGHIVTTYDILQDGTAVFKAVITPDIEKPARIFTGYSQGDYKNEKAFEKLETVAVGRALAFMGIGVIESIASADEIHTFQATRPYDTMTDGLKLPHSCVTCDQPMTYKEGTTKTGKPYKGWFCADKTHKPEWVN